MWMKIIAGFGIWITVDHVSFRERYRIVGLSTARRR
jgi:hypothetical protein